MKRDVKIYDPFNRPDDQGEIMSDESDVETAGYVPAEQQIAAMIDAGKRLGEARKEMYDYIEGEEEGFDQVDVPPDRVPGADIADASQLALALKARFKAQAGESVKEPPEAPPSPSVEPPKES